MQLEVNLHSVQVHIIDIVFSCEKPHPNILYLHALIMCNSKKCVCAVNDSQVELEKQIVKRPVCMFFCFFLILQICQRRYVRFLTPRSNANIGDSAAVTEQTLSHVNPLDPAMQLCLHPQPQKAIHGQSCSQLHKHWGHEMKWGA